MGTYTISKADIQERVLKLYLTESLTNEEAKSLQAGERMLADSEHLAFVYIIDQHQQFVYLRLPETIWSALKEAYDQRLPVNLIVNNEHSLELTGFHEELNYLINNIEDNSNYGEEMVQHVEKHFMKGSS